MTKRVILGEGRNDGLFLKELLTKKMNFKKSEILHFDQKPSDSKDNLKFSERKCFDRLTAEWEQYKLLIKSEGGRKKIIDIAMTELCYLCKQRYNPIILIDLDGNPIKNFIDSFMATFKTKFKCYNPVLEQEELYKFNDILMHSMEIYLHTKHRGTMYVIAFCEDLEHATGIDNSIHTDEEKIGKIQTYIEGSQIHNMFNRALTNS